MWGRRSVRLLIASGMALTFASVGAPATAGSAHWTVVRTKSPSDQANYLSAVVSLAANDAWTVGAHYRPSSTPGTLTEHWDGSRWTVVPSPNATRGYNELYGVAAVSPSDMWAVGYHNISAYGSERTLALHWNGTAWSIAETPNIGTSASFLYGVSAAPAGDVWAVGEGDSTDISTGVTLAMRWTGTRWRVVSTPNDGSGANALYAVTAVSDTDVWAVGESDSHGALILH